MTSRWVALLVAASAFAPAVVRAQTDPRLVAVVRQAQEGQSDSARATVGRLLQSTPPTDSLYPEILYTQAMVASDAGEMRTELQRIAVEYSTSAWADDALLRLVQMDYATRNLSGAARNLEKLRADYPASNLLAQASYWAARVYFDQSNSAQACRWLADGLTRSQGNVELQNQLGYLNQRCANVAVATGDSTRRPRFVEDGALRFRACSAGVGLRGCPDGQDRLSDPDCRRRKQGSGERRRAQGARARTHGEDPAREETLQGESGPIRHTRRGAGGCRRPQGQAWRHGVRGLRALSENGMVSRRGGASLLAVLIIGCSHPAPTHVAPAPVAPPTPSSACLIGTSGVASGDTITVIVPQQDSASVASANEYDTLIRLDCEGRPIPGLASSWTHNADGSAWTFVFSDSSAPRRD